MSLATKASANVDQAKSKLGRTTFGNARDNVLLTGTDDTLKDANFYDQDRRTNATRKISWAQRSSQVPYGRTAEREVLTEGHLAMAQDMSKCQKRDLMTPLKVLPHERTFTVCKFQTAVPMDNVSKAVMWRAPEEQITYKTKRGKEISRKRDNAGDLVFDVNDGDAPILSKADGYRSWDGRLEGQAASYCLLALIGTETYLVPVDQWYTFNPRVKPKLHSAEEAEKMDEMYRGKILMNAKRLIGRNENEMQEDAIAPQIQELRRKKANERIDVDDEVGDEEKLQFDDDSDGVVSMEGSEDRMLAQFKEGEDEGEDEEEEEDEDEARREFRRQKKQKGLTEDGNAVKQLLKKQRTSRDDEEEEDEESSDEEAAPTPSSSAPAAPPPASIPEPSSSGSMTVQHPPKPIGKKGRRSQPVNKSGPAVPMPTSPAPNSLEGQIRQFFQMNGNHKTPVKHLMKHLMKVDAKYQAVKANKDQKEAYFKRMVANTNKVIADIGMKEQQDGEILVWLR